MTGAITWREHLRSPFVVLLCAAIVIGLRNPSILLHGRVYAEEGTTYLRYAWEVSCTSALLATHQGYYSLVPNGLGVLAARALPLSGAALLFPWVAFGFQLLAVWLVVRCEAFEGYWIKVLATLVVVLAPPSGEVWLNTVNTQFYLSICCVLLIISVPRRFHLLVLAISGLTGVVSCFLLPFFWLRYYLERRRNVLLQALLLSGCTLVQLLAVSRAGLRHVVHHGEFLIEACADKNVLFAFGSSLSAKYFGVFARSHPTIALLPAILLLLAMAIVLRRVISAAGRTAMLLVAMGVWGELLNLYGGLDVGSALVMPIGNARYFLLCNVCIGLALVLGWKRSLPRGRMRVVTGALLVSLLVSGGIDFVRARKATSSDADWSSQVRAWEKDPNQPMLLAPTGWRSLYLTKGHPELDLPSNVYDSSK